MQSLRPAPVNFNKSWTKLRECLHNLLIFDKSPNEAIKKDDWLQLFTDVYSLCISSQENMYEKLYNNLDEFLSGHVATILKDITAVSKKDLLVEYENHWTHYNRIIVLLDGAFGHLNRQYVKNAVSRERIRAACYLDRINMDYTSDRAVWLSVSELALVHWRNVLMPTVKDDIIKTSLNLIGRDRQCGIGGGGDISKIREQANAVKCVCESLVNTQFCQVMLEDSSFNYNDSFEKPLLQLTCQFYQNIAKQTTLNDSYDALDYIVRVSELVEEERSRMEAFICNSSYRSIINECRLCLLEDHIPQINKFLKIFLFDKDEDAITTYYKLFKEMDNLDELVKSFSEYVHCQLSSDQLPMTDPLTFVPTFLKIYRKLQNMVRSLMSSDIALIKALDESVFAVVNQKREHFNESPTLLLSLYMDSTLRNKHANCKDIKDALLIFKYINDKDVFYTFYLKHMILRLVYSQNSRDFGLEEDVLCKLKKVFVTDFISKPQHILTDYTLSNQLSKSFSLQYGRSFPYKFAVSVFRSSSWPLTSTESDDLENVLKEYGVMHVVSKFERFYSEKHNGRKLRWLSSLTTVETQLNYLDKPYLLLLTVQQFGILSNFLLRDRMTLEYLKKKCQYSQFENALKSLLKFGIIKVNGDKIALNFDFHSNKLKHCLYANNYVPDNFMLDDDKKLTKSIEFDRDYFLQALIIRIMKSKQTLKHSLLVAEVIEKSKERFTPDVAMIRRSVESLVEREFIQKSKSRHDEYVYMA